MLKVYKSLVLSALFLISSLSWATGGYSPFGDIHWKPPVASSGVLPSGGNLTGDVRMELTTFGLYYWSGSGWVLLSTGGGGTPGGANTDLQFNSAGSFAGSANLTWNGTILGVTGSVNSGNFTDSALTSGLPILSTAPFSTGTLSGNTTEFATASGVYTSGDGIKIDAFGNLIDTGAASASVTSVGLSAPTGLSVAGSPVTGSGTLALSWSGTIPNAQIPDPTLSALGGAEALTCGSHEWMEQLATTGIFTCTQPSFSDLSGSASAGQLPNTVVYNNQANTYSAGPQSLGSQTLSSQLPNAGVTGTTLNKLAKINSNGSIVVTATTDTSGAFGVVVGGAGTTGSADVAQVGQASCVFDGATSSGDYAVISSTTAGDCHDFGASPPTSAQAVGRVLTTNATGGTYAMELLSGGGGGGGAPGGSNTDVQYNSSGILGGDSGFTYDGSGNITLSAKMSSASANVSGLTINEAVFTDGSKNLVSNAVTGTGNVVMSTSPTLVTPVLGTPASGVATNLTGLPLTTGVTGVLPIANGGTAVTSVTTTPTASSFAGWDANKNLSANTMVQAYATTATAAGTTTLTVASAPIQYFTGTTTQTIVLPVVSTLPQTGYTYSITNNSTGLLTVESSGANVISTIASGQTQNYRAILLTGTTAASWDAPSALGYVAQAQLLGTLSYTGCTSNGWNTTSTSFANFSAATGCTATVTGSLTAPGTLIPGFVIPSGAPGDYLVIPTGEFHCEAASGGDCNSQFRLSDGTNVSEAGWIGVTTSGTTDRISVPSMPLHLTYSSALPANTTIQIQGLSGNSAWTTSIGRNINALSFKVYYYPSQSQRALQSNVNYPTFSVDTSSTAANSTTSFIFSHVGNDSAGGYNATTGKYTIPVGHDGMWHFSTIDAAGSSTPININDGSTVKCQGTGSASSPSTACEFPVAAGDVIGVFPANSATGSGTSFANVFSGYQVITNQAAPILVGSVTSTGAGQYHQEWALIHDNGTTSSVTSQSGSWVSTATRTATGSTTLGFTTGEYSATPWCTCTAQGPVASISGVACEVITDVTPTSTTTAFHTATAGSAFDEDFVVNCGGPH